MSIDNMSSGGRGASVGKQSGRTVEPELDRGNLWHIHHDLAYDMQVYT